MSLELERDHWETWYQGKGKRRHCIGSTGKHREFKWSIINQYLEDIDHIIDVGCGDLVFWTNKKCEDYTGIDISKTVLEYNREKRPDWSFILSNASERVDGLHKPIVFCMDLLFHIFDDERYVKILENLCYYSEDWIFVYTWFRPKGRAGRGFTIYRPFMDYYNIFEDAGFELLNYHPSIHENRGAMFIFRKVK